MVLLVTQWVSLCRVGWMSSPQQTRSWRAPTENPQWKSWWAELRLCWWVITTLLSVGGGAHGRPSEVDWHPWWYQLSLSKPTMITLSSQPTRMGGVVGCHCPLEKLTVRATLHSWSDCRYQPPRQQPGRALPRVTMDNCQQSPHSHTKTNIMSSQACTGEIPTPSRKHVVAHLGSSVPAYTYSSFRELDASCMVLLNWLPARLTGWLAGCRVTAQPARNQPLAQSPWLPLHRKPSLGMPTIVFCLAYSPRVDGSGRYACGILC